MDDDEISSALRTGQTPNNVFRMHQGDSRNLHDELSEYFTSDSLADDPIDVTITSPPYADMKNYEGDEDAQIGFGDSYDDYLNQLCEVFGQIYDITAETGTLWIVVNTFRRNNRMVQLPSDITDVCENLDGIETCTRCGGPVRKQRETGSLVCQDDTCQHVHSNLESSWQLQEIVVWDKQRARPYTAENTFRNVFEYILCFSKTENPTFDLDSVRIADTNEFEHWWVDWPERYHPRGKVPQNIWSMVTPTQGTWGSRDYEHPAPFPPALVERIIRLTTASNDIVLDPFAGTGTVPIQANLMERRGIGFDISETYVANYLEVRSDLRRLWEERRDEGSTLEQQQRELAKVIWGLRQLVYSKHLFKEIRDRMVVGEEVESNVHSMFVRSQNLDPESQGTDEPVSTRVDFVFDDRVSREMLEDAAEILNECHHRDPWTGFNLDVTTRTWSTDEFRANGAANAWDRKQTLFLYPEGNHYQYEQLITQPQWIKSTESPSDWRDSYASKRYPPLISNISIRIDRTGDIPTIERALTDEPPKDINANINYREEITYGTTSTKLTDFNS